MRRWAAVWRRMYLFFRRGELDRELQEEIRTHLEMETEENIRAGMSPEEARKAARQAFGNVTETRERAREVWGFPALESFWQDLVYGLRRIAARPLYGLTVVLTLGLCLAVNAAVFNLLDSILLRPLSVPDPDRLVSLYHRSRRGEGRFGTTSYPDYLHYRDYNDVFDGLAAFGRVPTLLHSGEASEEISVELVTPNYFSVLGVRPYRGRAFSAQDEATSAVVLGERFWRNHLDGDASIVGRTLRVHSASPTVIGIAPQGFQGVVLDWGNPPDMWLLLESFHQTVAGLSPENDMLTNPRLDWLLLVGSLKNGVNRVQAEGRLEGLNAQLVQVRPGSAQDRRVVLLPTAKARFWPAYRPGIVTQLSLFMIVVLLVLSVACMNLVNLTLAEATRRRREMALRRALGAGRLRLVRQLVMESLPLALLAGGLGLLLAEGLHLLIRSFPKPFGISLEVGSPLHPRVVLFAATAAVAVAIICGALPAAQATRTRLLPALQMFAPSPRVGGIRVSRLMTIGQIAAALVILITGGLSIRAVREAWSLEIARDPEHLLVTRPNFWRADIAGEEGGALMERLLEQTRRLPMIRSAALARSIPLRGSVTRAQIEAIPLVAGDTVEGYANVISPGFFRTIGMTILGGRDFTDQDRRSGRPVAVVNEQMAARFWPGGDPVGQRFRYGFIDPASEAEIVGIVRDGGRILSVREDPRPCFYLVNRRSSAGMSLLMRFEGAREAAAAAVRSQFEQVNPGLPPLSLLTMEETLRGALSRERAGMLLFNSMGVLAGLVAIVGLYGVVSFSISQRTREIGIRLALGARAADIHRWVMGDGLVLLGLGVLAGLTGSFFLTRWMQSLFHGLPAVEPLVWVLAVACLGGPVLVASYLPARRAARVDPITVLRHE